MDSMWSTLSSIWTGQVSNFPLLVLQTIALVGVVATLLAFRRPAPRSARSEQIQAGLALGLCAAVFIGLVSHIVTQLKLPPRIYVTSDVLFLSGLLGGWWGGAICMTLVLGARTLFDTIGPAGLVDTSILTLGGIAMHGWFRRQRLATLPNRAFVAVWFGKLLCNVGSIWVLFWLGLGTAAFTAQLTSLRLLLSPFSLVLLASVLYLLRREAREDAAMAMRRERALTDPLTGLRNRRALQEHLTGLQASAQPPTCTLITFEVLNLNEMVRLRGLDWADGFWPSLVQLLQKPPLASALAPYRPAYFMFSDLALAGVLHGVSLDRIQHEALAEALHEELAGCLLAATVDAGIVPRICIGVASGSGADSGAEAIMRDLTLALLSDAQPVRYFDGSFVAKAAFDEQLRQLIRRWLDARQAPLHYQAKCELASGRVVGAEALLRGKAQDGRPIPPPQLLAAAARSELVAEFEWCTIETVVQAIVQTTQAGRPLPLAVNISAASLVLPGFGLRVVDLLHAHGVPGTLLFVEITEGSPVPEIKSVTDSLKVLADAGVRLSLDDFGTGHAALSMLGKFKFDEVKIDRSMVMQLGDPRMLSAVSLAYESAERYGASLIAEGVETQQQIDILLALGISRGQGFFFARAMELDAMLASTHFRPRTPQEVPRAMARAVD